MSLPYLFFKNNDEPQHFMTPSAIIAILSPSTSASSIKCVVRTMVLSALWRCKMSHICLRALGSIPDVGSSSITIYMKKVKNVTIHLPSQVIRFSPYLAKAINELTPLLFLMEIFHVLMRQGSVRLLHTSFKQKSH